MLLTPAGPYHLGPAPSLWGLPPHSFASSRVADIPGEQLEDDHAEPKLFGLPVLVMADSEAELDERLGDLGPILNPAVDVRVVFEREDGSAREITARCYDGADRIQVESKDRLFARVPLVFKAFDPYWRATNEDASEFVDDFNDGLVGGVNAVDLVNGGVLAWPEMTVDGPIENVELASLETGQTIRVLEVLDPGDQLRIVTDPAKRGVWWNGDLRWDVVSQVETELWPLLSGLNRLKVRGVGPGGGGTIGQFRFRWVERFHTC